MSLTIPLRNDLEDFDLQTSLDNVLYTLRFYWNRRDLSWYMDVQTGDTGAPILMGIRLVIDWPLGVRCRDPNWPPGMFTMVDTSNLNMDPGLNDLGARCQLLYFQASELPANPHNPPVP